MKTNILVVDDNELIRENLHDLLVAYGYSVFAVSDGLEALRILDKEQVELIITDIVMPDMEGLEFIRKIRSDKENPIKIIAISGERSSAGTYLNLASKFGADLILEKPFSNDTIIEAVQQLLS